MYSYFLWWCIHRQKAIAHNVPNRKKEHCNWWTPPLCIQRCSSSWTPMQILQILCHGGNLKLWRDIARFFVSWGYIEISPNNVFTGITKIGRKPWTWPQSPWIHQLFIVHAHFNHPNSLRNTPKPCECGNVTRSHRTVCFLIKNCLVGKYLDSSDSVGTTSRRLPFLPLIQLAPHENVAKPSRTL